MVDGNDSVNLLMAGLGALAASIAAIITGARRGGWFGGERHRRREPEARIELEEEIGRIARECAKSLREIVERLESIARHQANQTDHMQDQARALAKSRDVLEEQADALKSIQTLIGHCRKGSGAEKQTGRGS